MNAALRSGALDVVGVARLLAIGPDAPAALLQGRDSAQQVRPISSGSRPWTAWDSWRSSGTRGNSGASAREAHLGLTSGLAAFLKSLVASGWGTFRTKRLRART
jgi:hypothetical protein